jgi:hypothetical protein
MSKIALQGNASGTGTLTIAAPDTNTDRTLTLPDATGTVVLADATQTLTNKSIDAAQLTGALASALVGTATAGLAYGAVGTYVFGSLLTTDILDGSTYAGSNIVPAGLLTPKATQIVDADSIAADGNGGGTALSGTWRAMGRSQRSNTTLRARICLFLRVS